MNDSSRAITWDEFDVGNVDLELVDEASVESFRFSDQGHVAATIGQKNGAICAPLLYWHIEGDHLRIARSPRADIWIDLHSPRLEGNHLTATRHTGGQAVYAVRRRIA